MTNFPLSSNNRFGNGINGRLGNGDTKERRSPTLVHTMKNQNVVAIACGSAFTFALAEGGSVYSWGKNTAGQCGHGNLGECNVPRKIAELADKIIVDIAGGWDHALACTNAGEVFSWGCGYEGTRPVLGHGSKVRQHTPKRIRRLQGLRIIKVAAGYDHSLAVTSDGEVYSWGSSNMGQLGLGDTQEHAFPEKIKALEGHRIVTLDGGMDHTLFCSGMRKIENFATI